MVWLVAVLLAAVPAAPPTTPAPTLPDPPSRDADPVGGLLPGIVAGGAILDDAQRAERIAEVLASPSHQPGADMVVGNLCAIVPVSAPLTAGGRWERDGRTLREVDEAVRQPPGFGDCLGPAQGADGLDPGTYQFVAVGPTGAVSSAPTYVVGAPSVAVWLVNNGTEPVCLIQTSPRRARRYETFRPDAPWAPGETIAVRLAATEQELRVFDCPASGDLADADEVGSMRFVPAAGPPVELFPAATATTTTATPAAAATTTTAG